MWVQYCQAAPVHLLFINDWNWNQNNNADNYVHDLNLMAALWRCEFVKQMNQNREV